MPGKGISDANTGPFLFCKESNMDKKKVAVVFSPSNVPFAPGKTIGVYKDANDKIWFHGPDA